MALVVIALPITEVLYQRGLFDAEDTAATALALAIYGLGLPANKQLYMRYDALHTERYFSWPLVAGQARSASRK